MSAVQLPQADPDADYDPEWGDCPWCSEPSANHDGCAERTWELTGDFAGCCCGVAI